MLCVFCVSCCVYSVYIGRKQMLHAYSRCQQGRLDQWPISVQLFCRLQTAMQTHQQHQHNKTTNLQCKSGNNTSSHITPHRQAKANKAKATRTPPTTKIRLQALVELSWFMNIPCSDLILSSASASLNNCSSNFIHLLKFENNS